MMDYERLVSLLTEDVPKLTPEECDILVFGSVEAANEWAAQWDVKALAQSFLVKEDEDWTWVDPEDVKRLARAVLTR